MTFPGTDSCEIPGAGGGAAADAACDGVGAPLGRAGDGVPV